MNSPTKSKNILSLRECNRQMLSLVGGKAASLGEVIMHGIPCPDGFVLTTRLFDEYMRLLGLDQQVKASDSAFAFEEKTLEKLRSAIMNTRLTINGLQKEILSRASTLKSELFAVRSSATLEDAPGALLAGAFVTVLGVQKHNLLEKIKLCWASLFTESAAEYLAAQARRGKLHPGSLSMAVIVQPLIPATASGVVFTSLPGQRDTMLIEAGYGIGAIVDGSGTHDKYFVNKTSGKVSKSIIHNQRRERTVDSVTLKSAQVPKERQSVGKLGINEMEQVINLSQLLEIRFGTPQCVEFASLDGQVWITQARPLPEPPPAYNAIESLDGTW